MALSVYGAAGTGTGFGTTGTVSITPQNVGDTLIVLSAGFAPITSILDTALNSWARRPGLTPPFESTDGYYCDEWYAVANGTSSTTLTISFASGTNAVVFGIAGAPTSSQFDVNGSLPATYNSGGNVGNEPVGSTTATNTVIFSVGIINTATPTVSGGWTMLINNTNYFAVFAYQIVSSAQTSLPLSSSGINDGILDAIVASSFTPLNLTDIVCFYRSDAGVTQSGGNVTAWADQTSNHLNLTDVGGSSPTYSATGFNGSFPGISFPFFTANIFLQSATTNLFAAGTVYSVFILMQVVAAASGGRFLSICPPSTGTDFTAPAFTIYDSGSGWGAYSSGQLSQITAATPAYVLLITTFNGANNTTYNGNFEGAPVSFSSTLGASGDVISIGGVQGNNSADFVIAAAGVSVGYAYNSTDIANLVAWASSTFGVSPSLVLLGPQSLVFM